jgi:hypothetical protein
MGLSLLAPAFLAGLLLLAVPIWVHLQKRHRNRVVKFPSLMFLEAIERPSMRRQRIRHWSLLVLRSIVIAALVLAFARPLLDTRGVAAATLASGGETVILLDHSYSLGYGDRWQAAREAALAEIEALAEGDLASVVLVSDRATVLSEATSDRVQLRELVSRAELVPRGTSFSAGVKVARKLVLESRQPQREVVLISDFQSLAWDRGEDLRLPAGTEVRVVDVGQQEGSDNLAVSGLVLDREEVADRERLVAQARVTRRGGEGVAEVEVALEMEGREVERQPIELQGSGSQLTGFSPLSVPPGVARGRIVLPQDALAIDDELFFVVSRGQTLPVLVLAAGRSGAPPSGLFVEQALSLGREPAFETRRRNASGWNEDDLDWAAVVMLSDVQLDASAAAELKTFVEAGGGLFVGLGSRSAATHANLAAVGLAPAPDGGQVGGPGASVARLSLVDRQHPDLEVFAAPRTGDFGTARFFRRHALTAETEGDRVLARFDDGGAALVERRVGKGRVLIWASTVDTYWNDFALQPIFLPFVHQVVKSLAGFRPPSPWQTVGAVVEADSVLPELSPEAVEEGLTLLAPGGGESAVGDLITLEEQGFYEVRQGRETLTVLAVNLDVSESDLTRLDVEELVGALKPPIGGAADGGGADRATPFERERSQGLWRFLVLAGLLLLVGEMFLADRLTALA